MKQVVTKKVPISEYIYMEIKIFSISYNQNQRRKNLKACQKYLKQRQS